MHESLELSDFREKFDSKITPKTASGNFHTNDRTLDSSGARRMRPETTIHPVAEVCIRRGGLAAAIASFALVLTCCLATSSYVFYDIFLKRCDLLQIAVSPHSLPVSNCGHRSIRFLPPEVWRASEAAARSNDRAVKFSLCQRTVQLVHFRRRRRKGLITRRQTVSTAASSSSQTQSPTNGRCFVRTGPRHVTTAVFPT